MNGTSEMLLVRLGGACSGSGLFVSQVSYTNTRRWYLLYFLIAVPNPRDEGRVKLGGSNIPVNHTGSSNAGTLALDNKQVLGLGYSKTLHNSLFVGGCIQHT